MDRPECGAALNFDIYDAQEHLVLRIVGPSSTLTLCGECEYCSDLKFTVFSAGREVEIGRMSSNVGALLEIANCLYSQCSMHIE